MRPLHAAAAVAALHVATLGTLAAPAPTAACGAGASCGAKAAEGTKAMALLQVNNGVLRKVHGSFEQGEEDSRPRPCVTRYDSRATAFGYFTSPPGTECVFGMDARDEGTHCILDNGEYGSYGWCYTSSDRTSWGSCSVVCPLFGASKVLGDRIDRMRADMKEELRKAVNTLPPMTGPVPVEQMPFNSASRSPPGSSSTTSLHIPQAIEVSTTAPLMSTVAAPIPPAVASATTTPGITSDGLSPDEIVKVVTEAGIDPSTTTSSSSSTVKVPKELPIETAESPKIVVDEIDPDEGKDMINATHIHPGAPIENASLVETASQTSAQQAPRADRGPEEPPSSEAVTKLTEQVLADEEKMALEEPQAAVDAKMLDSLELKRPVKDAKSTRPPESKERVAGKDVVDISSVKIMGAP
mmetsp:Transcript_122404/g.357321  ORF Transcript_122404/g.357321 Transcript_122404/m.357321 type:complete len:412 (-) Transcript_122404:113-1348(-)